MQGRGVGDRVASPINITTMRDVDDAHNNSVIENLINHPELSPSRRVSPLELVAKWLANAVWILGKWTSDELPARNGHNLGEHLGQSPSGSAG
jgi:hypothetical protein